MIHLFCIVSNSFAFPSNIATCTYLLLFRSVLSWFSTDERTISKVDRLLALMILIAYHHILKLHE